MAGLGADELERVLTVLDQPLAHGKDAGSAGRSLQRVIAGVAALAATACLPGPRVARQRRLPVRQKGDVPGRLRTPRGAPLWIPQWTPALQLLILQALPEERATGLEPATSSLGSCAVITPIRYTR